MRSGGAPLKPSKALLQSGGLVPWGAPLQLAGHGPGGNPYSLGGLMPGMGSPPQPQPVPGAGSWAQPGCSGARSRPPHTHPAQAAGARAVFVNTLPCAPASGLAPRHPRGEGRGPAPAWPWERKGPPGRSPPSPVRTWTGRAAPRLRSGTAPPGSAPTTPGLNTGPSTPPRPGLGPPLPQSHEGSGPAARPGQRPPGSAQPQQGAAPPAPSGPPAPDPGCGGGPPRWGVAALTGGWSCSRRRCGVRRPPPSTAPAPAGPGAPTTAPCASRGALRRAGSEPGPRLKYGPAAAAAPVPAPRPAHRGRDTTTTRAARGEGRGGRGLAPRTAGPGQGSSPHRGGARGGAGPAQRHRRPWSCVCVGRGGVSPPAEAPG